jgi:hypothetical protein
MRADLRRQLFDALTKIDRPNLDPLELKIIQDMAEMDLNRIEPVLDAEFDRLVAMRAPNEFLG